MSKFENVKAFVKEHKGEIALVVFAAANYGMGYFIGSKYSTYRISCGMEKFNNAGFVKFFDPATGLEVTEQKRRRSNMASSFLLKIIF